METVGKKITFLDPFSVLVVILAQAIILHFFTQMGVPVSSSQAIVGAVIGVGLVKGTGAIKKEVVARIGLSWLINFFGAILLAYLLGYLGKILFV
jgi:PiT family inorganic phosphate transporter